MFSIAVVCLIFVSGCPESEPEVQAQPEMSQAERFDAPSTEAVAPEATTVEQEKPVDEPLPKPASRTLTPRGERNLKFRPTGKSRRSQANAPYVTAGSEEMKIAEQTILKGWENIKSISAKMTSLVDQQGGIRHRRTGEATIDYKVSKGAILVRMMNFDSIWADVNGQQVFTGERTTKVYDGEFLYTVQQLHDRKNAYKTFYKQGVFPALGGPDLLKQLSTIGSLRLDPNFDLDGKIVYRFVGRTKPHSYMLAVDKETGLLLKLWVTDSEARSKSEADFVDYVINPVFADDHFKFKLPEDTKLTDLTVPAPPTPKPSETKTP